MGQKRRNANDLELETFANSVLRGAGLMIDEAGTEVVSRDETGASVRVPVKGGRIRAGTIEGLGSGDGPYVTGFKASFGPKAVTVDVGWGDER